jgi:hypothetical protein
MRKSIKPFAASAFYSLAFILLSSEAKALPTASVTVGGTQYNITYFQGDYNSNIAKFETPANNGLMPWWGSEAMATLFSDALGLQLGTPNPPPPFSYSPLFAYIAINDSGKLKIDAIANAGSSSFNAGDSGDESLAYAILATPTAVPGPAPIFGAAAAFGMSRRLRRRIKLGA